MIALAVRDVFDTLFHPHGRGVVSEALVRGTWRLWHSLARGREATLSYAGPTAFLLVVLSWVALVVVGFALILLPHLPEEFVLAGGLRPEDTSGFVDAIYVSMVSMTSLGFGDVTAENDLLRLLGPAETIVGLGILTASISWILSIYGVLVDYRSVSHEIALLSEAERRTDTSLARLEPAEAVTLLGRITSQLVAARRDLLHFPIAYYFHTRDHRYALSLQLPKLLAIAAACAAADRPAGVRLEAERVRAAADDLLVVIAEEFLGGAGRSTAETIDRFQRDQMRDVGSPSRSRASSTSS
jgi:hypothetical protein